MKRVTIFLSILFLFVVVPHAFSQTPTTVYSIQPELQAEPTPTPVEYTLPYPGLLPENPLYKIKTFRDWLISILIADPLKKASFDVLQADKRLAASQMLFQEASPNVQLAIETLSKGENYFYSAVQQMQLAKKQGASMYDIVQKLRLSNAKHLEIVKQMEQGKQGIVLQELKAEEKRIQEFGKTVASERLN